MLIALARRAVRPPRRRRRPGKAAPAPVALARSRPPGKGKGCRRAGCHRSAPGHAGKGLDCPGFARTPEEGLLVVHRDATPRREPTRKAPRRPAWRSLRPHRRKSSRSTSTPSSAPPPRHTPRRASSPRATFPRHPPISSGPRSPERGGRTARSTHHATKPPRRRHCRARPLPARPRLRPRTWVAPPTLANVAPRAARSTGRKVRLPGVLRSPSPHALSRRRGARRPATLRPARPPSLASLVRSEATRSSGMISSVTNLSTR